jgi:hypothetical protein
MLPIPIEISPRPINWQAMTRLAQKYLSDDFQLDPDQRDGVTLFRQYKKHVAETLHGIQSKAALERKIGHKVLCTADVFVELIRQVNPMRFWPDITTTKHPAQAYWEAHRAAAEKRFGLPGDRLPDILLQAIDMEFLHVLNDEERKQVRQIVDYGKALIEAIVAHYGKPMTELTWHQIDRFEGRHADASLSDLKKLMLRKGGKS